MILFYTGPLPLGEEYPPLIGLKVLKKYRLEIYLSSKWVEDLLVEVNLLKWVLKHVCGGVGGHWEFVDEKKWYLFI